MGFLADNALRAVAFDIDGTFYPLKETKKRILIASIFHLPFAIKYNRARQELRKEDSFKSLKPLTKEENGARMCLKMYGKDDESTVKRFLEKEKRVFTDRYYELFKDIKPYDGVKELLSLLKEKGYPMAVLSDFPLGSKLKSMGLEEYFLVAISSEDLGRSKPCSTPFNVLSSKLNVDAKDILYVGDSPYKDIEGAKKCGFKSALITKDKSVHIADLTVSDWAELKDRLF